MVGQVLVELVAAALGHTLAPDEDVDARERASVVALAGHIASGIDAVRQLDGLVDGGNTVIVVEHDMRVVARSDWVIDMGPGAGDAGGAVVAAGVPADVARARHSRTARFQAETSA